VAVCKPEPGGKEETEGKASFVEANQCLFGKSLIDRAIIIIMHKKASQNFVDNY
jgi:hypothetical protein